jgi:hypothetical protein
LREILFAFIRGRYPRKICSLPAILSAIVSGMRDEGGSLARRLVHLRFVFLSAFSVFFALFAAIQVSSLRSRREILRSLCGTA